MGYTKNPPWQDGLGKTLITAATLQHIEDGLFDAAATADVASATMAAARLMKRTTTFPVPDQSTTAYFGTFQTTIRNVGDIAYGGGIYTTPTAGLYQWSAAAEWQAVAANATVLGRRRLFIKVNGTQSDAGMIDEITPANQSLNITTRMLAGGPISLNANDQIQLFAYNTTGQTATVEIGCEFGLVRVS